MKKIKRIISLVLVLALLAAFFSGCKTRVVEVEEIRASFINILPEPDAPHKSALQELKTGLAAKASEKFELNDDTIGWLSVEKTTLDDEVMFYPDKKNKFYYLRKDFYGNYSFAGTYFIDYRSKFDGGREGMSDNNVIYGHSMTDNPEDSLFSQLKKFKDVDFAKNTPYVYFSTLEEDMAWEVFAIFVTHTEFDYINPNPNDKEFQRVLSEARSKSIYNYDVDVTPEDKILTLSTCLYEVEGAKLSYPNNYRYVIMAKLVPSKTIFKNEAVFEVNEKPVSARKQA